MNTLIDGYRWAENLFAHEHVLGTGEHNAAPVPREVGSVYITAGPTGNKEDFRYVTGATRSALGTIQLATNSAKYLSTGQMALQVTNMSETGITKPCLTTAAISSTSLIEFYSKNLSSALGAGNAWVAEDAHFCAAIHGDPLVQAAVAAVPVRYLKGEYFTDTANDWNSHVIADAGLRAAFLAGHSTAGVHTVREVARTWAQIYYSGGGYRVRTQSPRNPVSAITTVGTGHCRLAFTNAWTLSAQPLLMIDYARSNSGSLGDIIVGSCPRSLVSTTQVEYYFYKYDTGAKTWARYDTDFFTAIHAG